MPRFSDFDTRHYRTVDVRIGYREWVPAYERTVENEMDIALLESLVTPRWNDVSVAVDLGCGTGRTGAWLRAQGVAVIDGVDLTPEMLEVARSKGVYRKLVEADVTQTGLEAGAYDLVTVCLVDEHLPDVAPLYAEASRLAAPAGLLVLVGYHPQFIMASGMPTHFTNDSGEHIAIETNVHLLSEHVMAALGADWTLVEMRERVIDEKWLALKPKWGRFRGQPFTFALVCSRA